MVYCSIDYLEGIPIGPKLPCHVCTGDNVGQLKFCSHQLKLVLFGAESINSHGEPVDKRIGEHRGIIRL